MPKIPATKVKRKFNPSRLIRCATLALAAGAVAIELLGCATGEPQPFDPRTMGQGERLASRDARTYRMPPLPTTLETPYLEEEKQPSEPPTTGPSLGTEPQARLSLQEIIHRAVANSSDIKVAAYQPAIDQTRVIEAEARFDPSFFASFQAQRQFRKQVFPVAGAVNGEGQFDSVLNQTDLIGSVGFRQLLESGGSIELRNSTQLTYNKTLEGTDAFTGEHTGTSPAIQNEYILQITQPLLRDFGNEINRARIVINRYNQRISLLDFRKQIEDTIADIEQAYWDLVQAERVVKIQEDLIAQTIDTAQRLVERRGTDVTRVQISQTIAQLESRTATLVRAKAEVKNLSDRLKRNMNDPEFPISGPVIVLPASPPLDEAVKFDPQEVIDTALANRLELGQQQLRVDSATTALQVGKNNLLPQLNAAGSISLQGLGGDTGDVFDDQLDRSYVSWSFGLELEIPIGNRAARATYQRALMQRAQAIESYAAAIATVTFECKTALTNVQTAWEALAADRRSVFAATDALQWVDARTRDEALTPELLQLKLQYQDILAESRRAEAASLTNYNQAIARLEQVKGTLLQYNNVVMEEEMIPYERKWMSR